MAGTWTIERIVQHDFWKILVLLEAQGESTRIWLHYQVLPPPAERPGILQAYADEFDLTVSRRNNPLNKYKVKIEDPLVEHTRDVFRFIVQGIIDTPGVTLNQALNALVAEFPASPFGDFVAFINAVENQLAGISTWADFKAFVLANTAFFDPEALGDEVP